MVFSYLIQGALAHVAWVADDALTQTWVLLMTVEF